MDWPKRQNTIIDIVTGTGIGPTTILAFHAALESAGIEKYNLVRYSSVIPPYSRLEKVNTYGHKGTGERMFLVYATETAKNVGETAAAGIAWKQPLKSEFPGYFVEHEYAGKRNALEKVKELLATSISRIGEKEGIPFHSHGYATTSITLEQKKRYACAFVGAVYKIEPSM